MQEPRWRRWRKKHRPERGAARGAQSGQSGSSAPPVEGQASLVRITWTSKIVFWNSGVAPFPGPLPLLRSGTRGTGAVEGAELTGLAVLGGRRPPLQAAATAVIPAKDQYREAPSAQSMTILQQPNIFRKHDNIFKNNV